MKKTVLFISLCFLVFGCGNWIGVKHYWKLTLYDCQGKPIRVFHNIRRRNDSSEIDVYDNDDNHHSVIVSGTFVIEEESSSDVPKGN